MKFVGRACGQSEREVEVILTCETCFEGMGAIENGVSRWLQWVK